MSKSSKTDGKDKGRTKREKLSPTMPFEEAFDEMFPNKTNEYYRKYIELIDYAKSGEYELQEYYEKHHIVPRSFYEKKHMSIDNSDDNLVALNLADHFMAHWYITKCCVQKMKRSMEYAVVLMSNMVNCKTNREDTAIAKAVAFALSKVDKMKIPMSEEHRRKISEAMTGENNPNFGKNLSEETRKKLSEAMGGENNPMYGMTGENSPFYGKHHTEETKKKLSEFHTGKHLSDETRRKMSDTRTGKIYAPTKSVVQYSKDGEFIAEYPSIMEAERQTGCDKSSIISCCKGKRKSAGGYIWKYKE